MKRQANDDTRALRELTALAGRRAVHLQSNTDTPPRHARRWGLFALAATVLAAGAAAQFIDGGEPSLTPAPRPAQTAAFTAPMPVTTPGATWSSTPLAATPEPGITEPQPAATPNTSAPAAAPAALDPNAAEERISQPDGSC